MDGVFHAEGSGKFINVGQCIVECWCVFDAISPVRSEFRGQSQE